MNKYLQIVCQNGMTWLWTDIRVMVVPHSTEVVVVRGPQKEAKTQN
jgi:hypothetical protein